MDVQTSLSEGRTIPADSSEALPGVDKLKILGNEASLAAGPERHVARDHLLALDGVRGLAILMVIVSHAIESNYEAHGMLVRVVGTSLR